MRTSKGFGAFDALRSIPLGQTKPPTGPANGIADVFFTEDSSTLVVVVKGDRFILRRPSPGATIGGGVIVDPYPKRRHKRFDAAVIARLETLVQGTPGEILIQALDALGPGPLKKAIEKAGLDHEAAKAALAEVRESGDLIYLEGEALVVSRAGWNKLTNDLGAVLTTYHTAHPLRAGISPNSLSSSVKTLPSSLLQV